MKRSDSDLKVNRNTYPDVVTCDRMRLIGPKCNQLGPINIVYLKSPNEKTNSLKTNSSYYAVKPLVIYNTRVMLPSAKKDCVPTTQKSCVVYEFSWRCQAWYVGRTTQRLADRIKQHVPMSIRKKINTIREQPPRICKKNNSKINCESAIGQHLVANPECAKTYTGDNFRIIGQARSSFHLSVLESVLHQD